jgi:hypothetical protein
MLNRLHRDLLFHPLHPQLLLPSRLHDIFSSSKIAAFWISSNSTLEVTPLSILNSRSHNTPHDRRYGTSQIPNLVCPRPHEASTNIHSTVQTRINCCAIPRSSISDLGDSSASCCGYGHDVGSSCTPLVFVDVRLILTCSAGTFPLWQS